MERIDVAARPGWEEKARAVGFPFFEMYGKPYWVDDAAYAFTLREIERDIEDPSQELHDMCLHFVADAVESQEIMESLAIPSDMHDYVASTWKSGDRSFYGRFDLAYRGAGEGPAKLLEYNADTPTSLFESAAFQWGWLEDQVAQGRLPRETDQFNSIHEAILAYFAAMPHEGILHFAGETGSTEDGGLLDYLAGVARQAGLGTSVMDIVDVCVDAQGRFAERDDPDMPRPEGLRGDARVIDRMFKLYAWEDLLRDDRLRHVHRLIEGRTKDEGDEAWEKVANPDFPPEPFKRFLASSGTLFLEPAWKVILSNKALLPWLWRRHKGHPNLLPAFFETDPAAALLDRRVRKPIFSREGQNVTIDDVDTGGVYGDEGFVVQEYEPLFHTGKGGTAVIGSWIVGDKAVGIGMREDHSLVTQNLSRFVPSIIV